MSLKNIDLDINNYSFNDILNIFGFKIPHNSENIIDINITELKNKKCKKIENITEAYNSIEKEKLAFFFDELYYKLLNYINVKKNIYTLEQSSNKNTETSFLYTFPQKYVPGIINPLDKRVNTKVLNIDTTFRDDPTNTISTDCTISLPETIQKVVSLKLSSLEIPNTIYTYNSSLQTNIFHIITYGNAPIQTHIIEIKEGNYDSAELVSYLNALLNSLGGQLANIETSFDSKYGRFIFKKTATSPLTFKFNLDFSIPSDPLRNIQLNIGWILGYKKQLYIFDEDYSNFVTVTKSIGFNPEGIYNYIGYRYFYFSLNEFKNNYQQSIIPIFKNNTSFVMNDILARLTITSDKNSIIYDNTSDLVFKKRIYFGPISINKFKLRLYDEHARIIDLNNMDFSFTIELDTIYNLHG